MDIKKIIVLMICFSSLAHQQETFLQAKQAYLQKTYDKALTLFESIEPKNSVVWYDIGMCLVALNNPLQALLALKKAQSCAVSLQEFQECQNMINWMSNHYGYDSADWLIWHKKIIFYFKSFLLLLLNYAAAGIMTLLLFLLYKQRYNKKTVLLLFIVVGLSSLIMNSVVATFMHRSYGIIIESTVVRNVPDEQGQPLGNVSVGQEVAINRVYGDWLFIKSSLLTGWINNKQCAVIG